MRRVVSLGGLVLLTSLAAACGGGGGSTVPAPRAVALSTTPVFAVPAPPSLTPPPAPAFAAPPQPSPGAAAPPSPRPHPAFFAGETASGNGSYTLMLPNGVSFGLYAYLPDARYISHANLGYEYVVDANDAHGGLFLYDFATSHWWYTARTSGFPYVYDYTLGTFLYYYPDPAHSGAYTMSPRWFYDFSSGRIISLPAEPLETSPPTAPPSDGASATPTAIPTSPATPTTAPTTTALPTVVPTVIPTVVPTAVPTVAPTVVPTATPTVAPTAVPTPTPTPTPTPVPFPQPVASPSSLSFTAVGVGHEQWFRVTEQGYTGGYTADATSCATVAQVTAGLPGFFDVYPTAAGTCSILITDERRGSLTVPITVTTTSVGGQ